jgi:hypothetical protein
MDIREYAHEGRWWGSIDGLTATSKDAHYDSDENVVISEGDTVPIRFEVCNVCDGRGEYVNPSIDSHGITRDEMDDLGEEFFDDYRSGVYNIPCGLCKGDRVVPVPSVPAHKSAIAGDEDARYVYAQEREMEVRMGY